MNCERFLCISKRVAQCIFTGSRPKLQQVCDQVYRKNPLSIAKPYEIIDQKSFPILQGLWYYSWAENDCQSNKTTTVVRERLKAAAGLYTVNLKIFFWEGGCFRKWSGFQLICHDWQPYKMATDTGTYKRKKPFFPPIKSIFCFLPSPRLDSAFGNEV